MFEKKKKLTSAIDVLQSLFENGKSPLSSQYVRWRLEQNWESVVGKTVAENARPANYYQGVLYLAVRHPVWIQHLKFMTKDLKENINRYAGKGWATDIKYFVEGSGEPAFFQRTQKD